MGELGRDQLNVGARARERRAQRAVVRRRVGRRIDDLNLHGRRFSPWSSPTASSTPTAASDLLACLDAIRATHPDGVEAEVLVLDNASDDGSADAVRALDRRGAGEFGERVRLIELTAGRARPRTTRLLLREAAGELCLLLNEDSELKPGAVEALIGALDANPRRRRRRRPPALPRRGRAGLRLAPPGPRQLVAAGALPPPPPGHPEPRRGAPARWAGCSPRRCSSAARQRSRSATSTPRFFVYSDETDFEKRLARRRLEHPVRPRRPRGPPRAARHRPLRRQRRVTEFHRGRDTYMRKHHGRAAAAIARVLSAWTYVPARAGRARPPRPLRRLVLAPRQPRPAPRTGRGPAEAAEAYNRAPHRRPGHAGEGHIAPPNRVECRLNRRIPD